MTQLVHVAVFEESRLKRDGTPGKATLRAYTMWYSPAWAGCCMHHVTCERKDAKAAAIAEHREKCMKGDGNGTSQT